MGTMKQFDAKKFSPTELEAPDGRAFTAASLAEYNELLAKGYSVKVKGEPVAETTQGTDTAALTADTAPASAEAQALTADPSADAAPAASGKASGRRSGGVQ